jgi:hypothetical protein
MSTITVFVTSSGAHSLDRVDDALPYQAELATGYALGRRPSDGHRLIFGPHNPAGLEADSAVDAGVLRVLDPS